MDHFFRKCSTCKGDLDWGETYYACSVSTCNRRGTDFAFCSVECWESHVPLLRHRDAWAEERRAPSEPRASVSSGESGDPAAALSPVEAVDRPANPPAKREGGANAPERARGSGEGSPGEVLPPLKLADRSETPEEVLVVASRLKAYIRARSGMNTSDGVLGPLSVILRDLCDGAIERAHADGRKTVLERDILVP